MSIAKALLLFATLLFCSASFAAPCTVPPDGALIEQLPEWYKVYIQPLRTAGPANSALTLDEIEAMPGILQTYHRHSIYDPLFFESLARQVNERYARADSFAGLDTQAASKLYQSSAGGELDFSLMCIETKTVRSPDDTFALTLFGVNADDCQHVGLRGLVFTGTLINGANDGACRPNHLYRKSVFIPLNAGTNTVTFLCHKDVGGCSRR